MKEKSLKFCKHKSDPLVKFPQEIFLRDEENSKENGKQKSVFTFACSGKNKLFLSFAFV